MTEDRVDIGSGVALVKSTDADYEAIFADLRDGDRAEVELSGGRDRLSDMEQSWTIIDRGNIVGFVALIIPPDKSSFCTTRYIANLTTNYAWKVSFRYARMARKVLKAVVERSAAWVVDFITVPMKKYDKACRLDERILRMHNMGEVSVKGEKLVIYHATREELMK